MTTTEATDKQRLATILLGEPVHEWIGDRRADGHSWRDIAQMLTTATGGSVVVSHESVRQWAET